MKTLRVIIFLVVALVQLTVPASAIWKHEQTLRHGRVWKLKTAPVDPEDAVRGRYIALRFAAEEVPHELALPKDSYSLSGKILYAVLKEGEDGFAQIDRVSETSIRGDNVINVSPGGWRQDRAYLVFPFNRFWVSEANAPAAEKAYLENSRRGKENAYVTVRVRDGDAALEQLYIDNHPLSEYLSARGLKK